jgi:hypothetical protein
MATDVSARREFMPRLALGSGLLAILFASSGCAGFFSAPVVPPLAFVYTNVQAPLDADHDETQLGTKRGVASTQNVLGIVSWGDASTSTAAQNGNVSVIRHADYEFYNVLGVYSRFTTIVRGD